MDTDNSVVMGRGGEAGPGWRWAKWEKMGNICNSVNKKKNRSTNKTVLPSSINLFPIYFFYL